ncbi:MAG TPA: hypothetical protein PLZ84_00720 [Clostridia bacterium]|nr:hypothetical protein [Clostridia bacterium]
MNKENQFTNRDISQSNTVYLEFLKDINEVSAACSTKTYIWGGLAIDICEGKFLREHGDLDGFTENMMAVLDELIAQYKSRGYQTEFLRDINMLVIRKNNRHAAFNPLDIDGNVAMWRHIGDQGTVFFPYDWLDKKPRSFYNIPVYTSGLYFEYGFRKIAHLINPEWKERDKDRIAIEYLESKITAENKNTSSILKCIWSYNPFWIKRGYNPFDKPALVWPSYNENK